MDWHTYFITLANTLSLKSKDSTPIGAVIVGPNNEIRTTGFNGFARGVRESDERILRPEKYLWVVHAEDNAVSQAARIGVSLLNCTLYLSCSPIPCNDCSKAIIQSGIKNVIGPDLQFPGIGEHWSDSIRVSKEMLFEAGVDVFAFNLTSKEMRTIVSKGK